jgi:FkbM family methyltransferase
MQIKNQINLFFYCSFFFIVTASILFGSDEFVTVEKGNVTHKFVKVGGWVDQFLANDYKNWELDTFKVFEKVKNKDGVAIDLGAWIGTTSIWLSKNFAYVVAVEADRKSLIDLEKNLKASNCPNVAICGKAVTDKGEPVVFGPRISRGDVLNWSTSAIKKSSDSRNDLITPGTTFKQIIDEYVTNNDSANKHKVTFIKCDIEGGEEGILEDILQYAYVNNCSVWMSFHYDWWTNKKITNFENLFNKFDVNCPGKNVSEYIKKNPFESVLFEPKIKT